MKKAYFGQLLVLSLLVCACSARALVILQYHHVSDTAPSSTSVSPQLFEAQLQFLENNNFKVIDIGELERHLKAKTALPDGSVIITFDDGYRSIYSEAYPLLKKRGWPFTVFVNSKPHDEKNPRYVSWQQLEEMSKNGATIANHSDSHLHMLRKKGGEQHSAWLARVEREIDFAESRIKKEIGKRSRYFAWPYGEYNGELARLLKQKGYIGFGQQSGPVSSSSNTAYLPRFPLGGDYGKLEDFATKVFSLPFPINSVETESAGSGRFTDPELPRGVDKPILRINTPLAAYLKNVQCFASGQGKIKTKVQSSTIIVSANRPLNVGRSRYNCTADSGTGRYYWYSQLFIRRNADGSWYRE